MYQVGLLTYKKQTVQQKISTENVISNYFQSIQSNTNRRAYAESIFCVLQAQ